jgi:polyferredoxin
MECIHCTQCADACDAIMDRVGKPRGLIRYSSQAALQGATVRKLRPRVVLYPTALAITLGGFLFALGTRAPADITVLRGRGEPYVIEPDGRVANQLRVKITNRSSVDHVYHVSIDGADAGAMIAPDNPMRVEAGQTAAMAMFVMLPADAFHDGGRNITVRVADGSGYTGAVPYRLVGPERDHDTPEHSNDGDKR